MHRRFLVVAALVLGTAGVSEAQYYSDSFERADGTDTGWSVATGDWSIQGGRLVGGPSGGESACFAGDPAVTLPTDFSLTLDLEWLAPDPPGGIGRHAGVMFCAQSVANRNTNSGYNVWWIDRASDRGLNLARRDGGAFTHLVLGTAPEGAVPPAQWRIEVIGDRIRVYGDDVLMIDHVDTTYRGGHFGGWVWNGEGNSVAYDNVVVEGVVDADDFSRGEIGGWFSHAGNWRLENDQLAVGPTVGEAQIFANNLDLPTDYTVEFDWSVTSAGSVPEISPHFSVFLNFNQPGRRWDAGTNGYQVHWINRESDFGFNLLRWDGATPAALQDGTGDLFAAPPATVRIQVRGDMIRVFGDDVLAIEIADGTYRGGTIGFWAWENGNEVEFDNVSILDGDDVDVFEDDFSPRPRDLGDWTVHSGAWQVSEDGTFVAGPATEGTEQHAFIGVPPTILPNDYTFSFDWNFLAPADSQPVGRHAGVLFGYNKVGGRRDADTSGYQLWWIDRESDRGLTLAHHQGGATTTLNPPGGTGDMFAQPPSTITISVQGDNIKVYGDGVLAIDVDDTSSRGGHFGLWTWDRAGNHVEFDNVLISGTPVTCDACAQVTSSGAPVAGIDVVSFDASCSFCPDATYTWDFGDGDSAEGVQVDHLYEFGGVYTVTLTAESAAGTDSVTLDVTVSGCVAEFSDDFERDDGPVTGWTIASGDSWAQTGGELTAGPSATEFWIWAGNAPVVTGGDAVFEFDHRFLAPGSIAAVGRHGGFQFHCDAPTTRSQFSGYFIDWIDRPADRGVRFTRVDGGVFNEIVLGQPEDPDAEPPSHYRVEISGANIRVYVDEADDPIIDLDDNTYRGGHFGFWTYSGDQEVAIDNLQATLSAPLSACVTGGDGIVFPGDSVALSGACSSSFCGLTSIESYDWDFGDGTTGEGEAVEHVYEVADSYVVTLTVTDDSGAMASVETLVTVSDPLGDFVDCFGREAAPMDGWSVPLGVWSISENGRAQTTTTTGAADAETWMWAGDPARPAAGGDWAMEFEAPSVLFTGNPADAVGRHFGIMFNTNVVTTNRFAADSSGYAVWWIDREADFGISLARWDGPTLTFLQAGTGDQFADPPAQWRIEVEGPMIRVYGDGILAIEAMDETYRGGYMGFWAWKNMALQVDSVLVGTPDSLPECPSEGGLQYPGDMNQDASVNIADAVGELNFLFGGNPSVLPCGDGAIDHPANLALLDHNGDGGFNISDPVGLLNWLFASGAPPVQGTDPIAIEGCPDLVIP